MAILVDPAIWRWRGWLWCHLVSDASFDELHAFAERLGLRREWFQGDHYDIPAHLREEALALGAEAVSGSVLVERLLAAGLRRPKRRAVSRGASPPAIVPGDAGAAPADVVAAAIGALNGWLAAGVAERERADLLVALAWVNLDWSGTFGARVYRGHAGYAALVAAEFPAAAPTVVTVHDVAAEDDRVVVEVDVAGAARTWRYEISRGRLQRWDELA